MRYDNQCDTLVPGGALLGLSDRRQVFGRDDRPYSDRLVSVYLYLWARRTGAKALGQPSFPRHAPMRLVAPQLQEI